VTRRVENALACENLVFVGRLDSTPQGSSVTWAYGSQNRFEEFWPATDHRDRVVNGQRLWDFPPQDRGQPYLASGTALIGGKLVGAYVTYFDRRYSLSPLEPRPTSACSTSAALAMGAFGQLRRMVDQHQIGRRCAPRSPLHGDTLCDKVRVGNSGGSAPDRRLGALAFWPNRVRVDAQIAHIWSIPKIDKATAS
jgi:hypothetical protein